MTKLNLQKTTKLKLKQFLCDGKEDEKRKLNFKRDRSNRNYSDKEVEILNQSLSNLDAEKRLAVYLKFWFDLDDYEISRCMNITKGRVNIVLEQALEELQTYQSNGLAA